MQALNPEPVAATKTYERIVKDIRCSNCEKLLTKLIFHVALPEGMMLSGSLSESGIEIKVGSETKCPRCKEMDNTLFVV